MTDTLDESGLKPSGIHVTLTPAIDEGVWTVSFTHRAVVPVDLVVR